MWVLEIIGNAIGLWLISIPFSIASRLTHRRRAHSDGWSADALTELWQYHDPFGWGPAITPSEYEQMGEATFATLDALEDPDLAAVRAAVASAVPPDVPGIARPWKIAALARAVMEFIRETRS